MKIHEYQGKQIFQRYGIATPKGYPVFTAAEAEDAAKKLIDETKIPVVVVKAQIHAGGRGKGGGVKVVKGGPSEVKSVAEKLLGMQLVTHQTGPEGQKVQRLYVEQGLDIARELYLGLVVDREARRIAVMASTEGGVEIETVAEETPEKILIEHVDPVTGLSGFQARKLAYALDIGKNTPSPKDTIADFVKLVTKLGALFEKEDCSLCEINPLVVTKDGKVVCLDAKMNFDDNALYRHKDIQALRDLDEEDPMEVEASKYDLNYIKLDGSIGCMVNGAGLAMATMDIIQLYGESPANFLDVGGGASTEKVTAAFKIILSDPSVKGILVNIFGGIMRCDIIAEGIVTAAKELALSVPVVVRLEGTNVEQGKKIVRESGLNVLPADNLDDAAQKIVKAVKGS
jgi:succinyl-CoA synthetase beta subunit